MSNPAPTPNNPKRSLPASLEFERCVISCMMQAPEFAGPLATERLAPEDFSAGAHGFLFELVRDQIMMGKPVDPAAIGQRVLDLQAEKNCGGLALIAEVYAASPNPAHVVHYAAEVALKSQMRRLVRASWEAVQKVFDECPDAAAFREIQESLSSELMALARVQSHSRKGLRTGREVTLEVVGTLTARYRQRGQPLGLTLGFPDLDRTINGLQPEDFVVVAARPAMGKTALATAFAEAVAINACNRKKRPVLMFTLEMSDAQIQERSVLGRAHCGLTKGRTGMFSDAEGSVLLSVKKVVAAHPDAGAIELEKELNIEASVSLEEYWQRKQRPVSQQDIREAGQQIMAMSEAIAANMGGMLSFYDGYGVTSQEMVGEIRRWVRRLGWKPGEGEMCAPLVIVDYLQLIKASGKKAKEDPRLRVNEACDVLKGIAKELGIVVMVLAQVGRSSEENAGKMPALKDLKESGAIEEYADYVMFIHRESYYKPWDKLHEDKQEEWNEWAKTRNDSAARRELKEDAWNGQTYYEAHATLGIRKGRHCATADIDILFHGPLVRFSTKTPALFSTNKKLRQGGDAGGATPPAAGGAGEPPPENDDGGERELF